MRDTVNQDSSTLCQHSIENITVNSATSYILQIDFLYCYPYWMTVKREEIEGRSKPAEIIALALLCRK